MTIYKSGTHDSSVIISSSIYSCSSCEHTEMGSGENGNDKKCPECGADMRIISASTDTKDSDAV